MYDSENKQIGMLTPWKLQSYLKHVHNLNKQYMFLPLMAYCQLLCKCNYNLFQTETYILTFPQLFVLFFFFFFCEVYIFPTHVAQIRTDIIDLLITAFSGPELFLLTLLNRKKGEENASQPPFLLHCGQAHFLSFGFCSFAFSQQFLEMSGIA